MRKQPKQMRSRATIEAMLQAAAHILGERGWDGLTTNHVAQLAGVSIGSLYQYFPHKLALVEAVRQRHLGEVLDVLHAASDTSLPRARRIEALVDGMVGIHSRFPAAHRVLLEEIPRGRHGRLTHDRFASILHERYAAIVRAESRAAAGERVNIAARVLAAAIAGVVHDAANQGTLQSRTLRSELTRLVDAYLR